MSKVSLADTLLEWESLLAALDQSGELDSKPYLRDFREQLDAMITAVKALAAEQAALEGRRQAITQQLRITRGKGQELAVNIRSAVKAALGFRNEGLVRYRIRPIRGRSRSKNEADGVAIYPRPDLLSAAGLAPKGANGEPSKQG